MAFASIVTLLLFYYIRPQDWMPGMSGFNMIKLAVAGGIVGLLQRSRDEPRWRFLSSPQEWALVIFLGYVVFTSPDPMPALTDMGVLVVFAFLGLHTLTTEELLERYLRWWLVAMVAILFMVLITMCGWDLTNARPLLDRMEGRWCLGTYTMNNPNAMGHTLVAVLPLGYFLWFWSSSVLSRVRTVLMFALGVWVVIHTQSKGAYISGAISFMVSVLFGRRLLVQVVVGLTALALGGTILATLPRMDQLKRIGSEEGVQGRMLAWGMARTVTKTHATGQGYKQFHAWLRTDGVLNEKSPHSAFVMVGGDLGPIGLSIYIGMLLTCARSLIQYKGLSMRMERCRRSLFALLMGLFISGWMLDRAYYTEVFCLIGAVGAYHLLSVRQRREAAVAELVEEEQSQEPGHTLYGLPAERAKGTGAMAVSKAADDDDDGEQMVDVHSISADTVKVPGLWTRLGFLDVALAVIGGEVALRFWDYVMETIKP